MYKKCVKIVNEVGLHARPASLLVMKAKEFESAITIGRTGSSERYNAKSLMKLLVLGALCGEEVELVAEGADEVAAVDTLCDLISNGLNE